MLYSEQKDSLGSGTAESLYNSVIHYPFRLSSELQHLFIPVCYCFEWNLQSEMAETASITISNRSEELVSHSIWELIYSMTCSLQPAQRQTSNQLILRLLNL